MYQPLEHLPQTLNDPVTTPFCQRLRGRVSLLVGLLIFQSVSSFILSSYSELLQQHSVIVYFLTMLVGAGGNAGNQAAVLVIRGLATGEIRAWCEYVCGEVKMAVAISIIMVAAGFARVTVFDGSYEDAIAIASSLLAIVFISIIVGASLPLLLHQLRFDPAHAGATIQVIMDLAGVLITCMVCSVLLPRSETVVPPHALSPESGAALASRANGVRESHGVREGRHDDAGWELFDKPLYGDPH